MLHELEHLPAQSIISYAHLNVWHEADFPMRSINVRFRGFPVTKLKTLAFFATLPPDLRLDLHRGRKGPWMRFTDQAGHDGTKFVAIGNGGIRSRIADVHKRSAGAIPLVGNHSVILSGR